MKTIEDVILLADSHHGVYIPQLVVQQYLDHPMWDWSEVDQEDIDTVLSGPLDTDLLTYVDDRCYWYSWENIMLKVIITDEHGTKYMMMENEDLWLVPVDISEEEIEQWII